MKRKSMIERAREKSKLARFGVDVLKDRARIEDNMADRVHADEYSIAVTKRQAEQITICKKAIVLIDGFAHGIEAAHIEAARGAIYAIIGALVCGAVPYEEV